jgi:cytochrome bd-type quinol oxidase subunit 1
VTSIIVFLLLYGALAVVDWWLMSRYARRSITPSEGVDEDVPELTY